MKKGFTLLELLAVITLLGLLAFIAVPITIGIINDAKKSAGKTQEELYIDAVLNSMTSKDAQMNFEPIQCQILSKDVTVDEITYVKGDLLCDGINYLRVKTTGKRPISGTIRFEKGKVVEYTINYK